MNILCGLTKLFQYCEKVQLNYHIFDSKRNLNFFIKLTFEQKPNQLNFLT